MCGVPVGRTMVTTAKGTEMTRNRSITLLASAAGDLESLSPYVEPPSIPEGVTVDEYRRARPPQTKPLLDHVLSCLRSLRPVPARNQRFCRVEQRRERTHRVRTAPVRTLEAAAGAGA
jgi:hypothetical protein